MDERFPQNGWRKLTWLCLGQGIFYFATGVWPLVHMASFVAVTGPKTDYWLVRAVGVLVAATGVALLVAGLRRRISLELAVVAAGQALGLGLIDLLSVPLAGISRIYFADAAVEFALVFLWIAAGWSARRTR